jgi:membrane complex biogenesis BtpA family protein
MTAHEPLDRPSFERRFGRKAVFAMVHLLPLPGAPLFGGSMDKVVDRAVADAEAIAAAGAAGIFVENFGDRPFAKSVGAVTVAAMTRCVAAIAREVDLPIGVNALRNDGMAALAIAAATGAAAIRINVLTGAMLTDQGLIEGDAAAVLRERSRLGSGVAIFADWMVKHAVPVGLVDPEQAARDLRERGLADAVVISGRATGEAADIERVEMARRVLPEAPLVIGSGLTRRNARQLAAIVDAAIVGSSVKRGGAVQGPIDRRKLEVVVESFA